MPNEKERKKKDGRNKSKKNQAMREAVKDRKLTGRPSRPVGEQPARQAGRKSAV